MKKGSTGSRTEGAGGQKARQCRKGVSSPRHERGVLGGAAGLKLGIGAMDALQGTLVHCLLRARDTGTKREKSSSTAADAIPRAVKRIRPTPQKKLSNVPAANRKGVGGSGLNVAQRAQRPRDLKKANLPGSRPRRGDWDLSSERRSNRSRGRRRKISVMHSNPDKK